MGQQKKNCMNEACRGTTSSEWKKGWTLKSGGFATLCSDCGTAYANSVFCETFHQKDSGWRECQLCSKRIHCGCVASRFLYEYRDFGGIVCINCVKFLETHSVPPVQMPGDIPDDKFLASGVIIDAHPVATVDDRITGTEKLSLQLSDAIKVNHVTSAVQRVKLEESSRLNIEECSMRTPDLSQQYLSSSIFVQADTSSRAKPVVKNISDSLMKLNPVAVLEMNKGAVISQTPIPRQPADGRGHHQLLPRYWPRISDQELQEWSGNLKSSIIPLFEKILSASDAGRIGRLVLPKACAEAYFPTINQSDGIPIRIQDTTGKEWTFQFRFWPNNNSRMYVLEGITPCIQNMQLQAGDAVIFSRIHPGGQLLLGCRKAATNVDLLDAHTSRGLNGDKTPMETSLSNVIENQLLNGRRVFDEFQQQVMTLSEKKRARNIKNKRLLMHNDDAAELRITWEEAQELLRPSPSSEPTVVTIDGHEFEEFEEPPIFGKRTFFITQPSRDQEQLVQCDSCLKWRILPVHALISANWTCSDNVWDLDRRSCSSPENINPTDVDGLSISIDSKRTKISDGKASDEESPSGLDALANAAFLGDETGEFPTTRHPRHRPGCTCIVCSQPPSGKGKHDPGCKCNVCLTVKRRFKTFSMRKKRRQSVVVLAPENDEGDTSGHALPNMNQLPANEVSHYQNQMDNMKHVGNRMIRTEPKVAKKGQLDLNCHPHNDDDVLAEAEAAGTSLTPVSEACFLGQALGAAEEKNLVGQVRTKSGGGAQENGRQGR